MGTTTLLTKPSTADPTVASLAADALAELPRLTDRLVQMIVDLEEPYDAIDTAELARSVSENLRRSLTSLAHQTPVHVDCQRETARRRAEEGVPLASVLHAFRLGFTVIWDALMERATAAGEAGMHALLEGTGDIWGLIDTDCDVVAVEYQAMQAELARRNDQRRRLLVDALFDGRLAEWQGLRGTPRELGLPDRGPYVAVAAETLEPGREALPGIEGLLAEHGHRSVWRLAADEQVGVVALAGAGQAAIGDLRSLLSGRATARVGLSGEYRDPRDTARSLASAALGRACLRAGTVGVAMADEDVLTALAVGSPELSSRFAKVVLGPLLSLRPDERDRLLRTLDAWFAAGGSVKAAGAALSCHRNTVRNRLARVEQVSGRWLSDPRGACELYLAARITQVLDPEPAGA
ncbi:MAG: PucR family transcriptional regulator [Acidimicrobiales bacterium]